MHYLERFYSATGFLLLAVMFVALNGLGTLLLGGQRIDLTEQGLYSLSDGTKEIIDSIEEPIQLYFFFSDLATRDKPQLRSYANRVRELLQEYAARGGDKLKLKVIDPEPFSEAEERAVQLGVQAAQGQAGTEALYFGLVAVDTLDLHKTIPLFDLERERTLEYDISQLLVSLVNPSKPVVGILSSIDMNTGGVAPQQNRPDAPWAILNFLNESFRIQILEQTVAEIPSHVDVLMAVRPGRLPKQAVYAIDQYVVGGGKAVVMVDPMSDLSGQERSLIDPESGVLQLLTSWGLSMEPYMLAGDPSLAITVQVNGVAQRHPVYMALNRSAIDENDVVTSLLDAINIGTAGVLKPLEASKEHVETLFSTSERGGSLKLQWLHSVTDAAELRRKMRGESLPGKVLLGVRVSGPVESAFGGRPDVVLAEGETPPPQDSLSPHRDRSEEDVNLIVVSDADWLHDQYWVRAQQFLGRVFTTPVADNASFVLNALENLSGNSALISVRSRGRFSRPFTVVEDIRQEADQRYRERSDTLERRLREAEQRLHELRKENKDGDNKLRIRTEQNKAIARFNAERNTIRRQLRDVRHQLNKDIDSMNTQLRAINIIIAPMLLVLGLLGCWQLFRKMGRGRRRLV